MSEVYQYLRHLPLLTKTVRSTHFVDKTDKLYPLFKHSYDISKKLYKRLGLRKDGTDSFLHPLNIANHLKQVGVTDVVTLSAALLHDYIEELVDIYKKEHGLTEQGDDAKLLDDLELEYYNGLTQELIDVAKKHKLPTTKAILLADVVHVLTRQKRHFYYYSVASIFTEDSKAVRERAIHVKLADRLHNIACVDSFQPAGRLYQGYKSLYILNCAKKYLLTNYSEKIFVSKSNTMERLFNKCAKRTYAVFQDTISACDSAYLRDVRYMLQLALKKYALQHNGLSIINSTDAFGDHPLTLYEGVVEKYDARLRKDWGHYDSFRTKEETFAKTFFDGAKKSDIEQILWYKDAYVLKEVVARLIYHTDFIVADFVYNELTTEGQLKPLLRKQ